MNFLRKNTFRSLFLYGVVFTLVSSTSLSASGSLDDLRGLVLKSAKIPIYQKKRLQMMIFADTATRQGKAVLGNKVVIELLKKKVDVDAIKDSWDLKPYRLRAPLYQVLSFWKDRISYSDGVITSHKANIIQENRTARGDAPVFFRSPILDINGIGFDADFKRRTIQINSDVRMTVRLGNSNPTRLIKNGKIGKIPAKYELARAAADSMIIDSASKQVILIGNVSVTDDSSKITCDRLTVYLGKGAKDKIAKDTKDKDDFGISSHGIEAFSADGNVILSDNKEDDSDRKVLAEHLNYNLKSGVITLTGSGVAYSSELSEDEQLARLVRVIDGDMKLSSASMIVYLDTKKKGKSSGSIGGISLQGNQESLKKIVMPEAVNVETGNNTSLVAKSGELDNQANMLYFRKDVVMNDPQMTLNCDNLMMKLSPVTSGSKSTRQLEFADALGNVKLVSKKANSSNKSKDNLSSQTFTTLTSNKAKLEYRNNLLSFIDNVKIVDNKGSLSCNLLTLYLKDKVSEKKADKKIAKSNVFGAGVAGKGKSLDKAIARGNVFMKDNSSELTTDKLTMLFGDLKKDQKGLPGMFQSGDVRLLKVFCDGNVLAKSSSSKSLMDGFGGKKDSNKTKVAAVRTIKSQHAITNLVTGIQEFHKDVLVTDSQATLACQEVYIYTKPEKNSPKTTKVVKKKTAIEEMDEDPFAIVSEDSIPATVSLGNGMELDKIICKRDIVIEQKGGKDNRNVKAKGELGTYIVADRKTVISGTSDKKPSIEVDGRFQECKQLIFHMEDERFEIVEGGPITKIDKK